LLRQILPVPAERESASGFGADPVSEQQLARNGCLQKYPGRALLITTGACPVHCRYCFRREFPYSDQTAARAQWQPALATLAGNAGIHEIILSGGDPLSLGNRQLGILLQEIAATLPQITTLRIHTRYPVVLPTRVDRGLVKLLDAAPFHVVVVLHVNHPAEIDDAVAQAAASLKAVSNGLLNQAVLLRGVNDDAGTLIELGQRLLGIGVLPYYLHLLDRVSGSAHFEVDERTALELIASMRRQAPGYLIPKLVREDAGELCKTPVG
jgi:EF-P beta-lysylation protein EpmB